MSWENIVTLIYSGVWYMILTLFIPSICFGKYLKAKSMIFRFLLYQSVGNLYVNYIVLGLGYLKIVNPVLLTVFLIIIPIVVVLCREHKVITGYWKKFNETMEELAVGTYGGKVLLLNIRNIIPKKFKKFYEEHIKSQKIEVIIYSGLMLWVIYYFGWYKFRYAAYAHGDEETHLYWITSLMSGEMFPAGMYPHAMHTIVAAIAMLSGLTVARVYAMFSVLSTILIFTTAYWVTKKLFHKPYIALMGWSIIVLSDIFQPVSYFRFQISFPMEFGLLATFGMMYAMFSYIEKKDKRDLILFALSITWTLAIHFYATILCAVICVCFGIVYFIVLLKKKMITGFLIAGITGILLALVPYGVGYLSGYEFERSIEWALGIAQTSAEKDEAEDKEPQFDDKIEDEEERLEKQEIEKATSDVMKFWIEQKIYLSHNFVRNWGIAEGMMLLNGVIFLIALLGLCFKNTRNRCLMYLFWSILWEVGAVMACAYYMKLPALIEVKRMATFLSFLSIPLFVIVADLSFILLEKMKVNKMVVRRVGFVFLAIELCFLSGNVKELKDLYYCITLSEEDMQLCLDLIENHEENDWTVISPINDLSVIRNKGYHYEITDLIYELDNAAKQIYIDTSEIYVVLEKYPTSFARENRKIDRSDILAEGHVSKITSDLALSEVNLGEFVDEIHALDAPYYYQRDILMSKVYYWIELIQKIYPRHVSIYSESEQVRIYKIEQDPYFKLNLAVDYKEYIKESVNP